MPRRPVKPRFPRPAGRCPPNLPQRRRPKVGLPRGRLSLRPIKDRLLQRAKVTSRRRWKLPFPAPPTCGAAVTPSRWEPSALTLAPADSYSACRPWGTPQKSQPNSATQRVTTASGWGGSPPDRRLSLLSHAFGRRGSTPMSRPSARETPERPIRRKGKRPLPRCSQRSSAGLLWCGFFLALAPLDGLRGRHRSSDSADRVGKLRWPVQKSLAFLLFRAKWAGDFPGS